MNKYNTKLGQLLSLLERPQFEKCVKATGADKHCKDFSAWQQFVTMADAQIANPHGLRRPENPRCSRSCFIHSRQPLTGTDARNSERISTESMRQS